MTATASLAAAWVARAREGEKDTTAFARQGREFAGAASVLCLDRWGRSILALPPLRYRRSSVRASFVEAGFFKNLEQQTDVTPACESPVPYALNSIRPRESSFMTAACTFGSHECEETRGVDDTHDDGTFAARLCVDESWPLSAATSTSSVKAGPPIGSRGCPPQQTQTHSRHKHHQNTFAKSRPRFAVSPSCRALQFDLICYPTATFALLFFFLSV